MATGTATADLLNLRESDPVTHQCPPQAVYNPKKRQLDTLVNHIAICRNQDRNSPVSLAEAFETAADFFDVPHRTYSDVIGTVMQTWLGSVATSSRDEGDFSMAGYVALFEDYDVAAAEEANMRAFEDVNW